MNINPMMPYRKWMPPDEWFDSPEWIVADAFLALRVDGYEMAPLADQLDASEDGYLALLALRNSVRSDDFAVIGGKVHAGHLETIGGRQVFVIAQQISADGTEGMAP